MLINPQTHKDPPVPTRSLSSAHSPEQLDGPCESCKALFLVGEEIELEDQTSPKGSTGVSSFDRRHPFGVGLKVLKGN